MALKTNFMHTNNKGGNQKYKKLRYIKNVLIIMEDLEI